MPRRIDPQTQRERDKFADLCRVLRRGVNLSQSQLARKCGLSRRSVYKIEQGERRLTRADVAALATVLTGLRELLDRANPVLASGPVDGNAPASSNRSTHECERTRIRTAIAWDGARHEAAKQAAAIPGEGEVVYLARCPRSGLLKIGWSRRVGSRAKHLGVTLLATMPGTRYREQALHQQFAAFLAPAPNRPWRSFR